MQDSNKSGFWTQKRAIVVLAFVGACWGLSYITMKIVMDEMTPFWMAAIRFCIAFVAVSLVFFKHLKQTNASVIKAAAVVGAFDAGIFILLLQGLKYTTATNAGFLCATSVVIVPILHALMVRKLPNAKVFVCCIVALAGIFCMTVKDNLSISVYDLWCLASAFCYAGWVLATSIFTRKVDGLLLGIWQLGFTALYLLGFAAITEAPCLPTSTLGWGNLLFMALFCTALCFVLQTVAQKYTTPEIASLLFCLEPVSSGFFGFLFFGESIGAQGYIGAALILLAVVLSTVKVKNKRAATGEV